MRKKEIFESVKEKTSRDDESERRGEESEDVTGRASLKTPLSRFLVIAWVWGIKIKLVTYRLPIGYL